LTRSKTTSVSGWAFSTMVNWPAGPPSSMVSVRGVTVNPARSSFVTLTLTVAVTPSYPSYDNSSFTTREMVVDSSGTVKLFTPDTVMILGTL